MVKKWLKPNVDKKLSKYASYEVSDPMLVYNGQKMGSGCYFQFHILENVHFCDFHKSGKSNCQKWSI